MVIKPKEQGRPATDPRRRAGEAAEGQMAHYLNRDFESEPAVLVLNDVRLVDHQQREHNGQPGVCQIDHLVLHRWGAFIIESKSVTDNITVRDDGTGGDEWTRTYSGRKQGIASPIQQARRQGEFLRAFLQRNREALLGKLPTGLRTIAKLVAGTDHRGFTHMPVQIIVAISDNGNIQRINKWKEPTRPFQTFVCKADLVPSKIREELGRHKSAAGLLGTSSGDYGTWAMKTEELGIVAEYLLSNHQPSSKPAATSPASHTSEPTPAKTINAAPRASPPSPRPKITTAACKNCGGSDLTAKYGSHGYYWSCNTCGTTTTMPKVCSHCGAKAQRDSVVRVRKSGPNYYRVCTPCGTEEQIWTET